ncbi:hypothetical protein [Acidovorax sp. Root219]|uniref:hypothetical protein n=1 Tax=Acidovorax sp. Root219 TaxID=1736493 RepID=UPI0012FB7712|nr:hypothetical protein [Acidovorax sp. Root219]
MDISSSLTMGAFPLRSVAFLGDRGHGREQLDFRCRPKAVRHIVGGDAVFMKRIFKAIGQLGSKADAAVLASRFDAAAEDRPDVLQAFEAALARLEKKKV